MTWRIAPRVGHVSDDAHAVAYLMRLPSGPIIIAGDVGYLIWQALVDGGDPVADMLETFGDSAEVRDASLAFLTSLEAEGLVTRG